MTIESDFRSSKKKVKLSDDDNIEDTDKQIPFPKFDVCETVLARDKDGLLYEAVVRRSLWGVQQHSQVTVGMSSHEEIEKFIEQERFPTWHYFVHYNKWKVKKLSQHSVRAPVRSNRFILFARAIGTGGLGRKICCRSHLRIKRSPKRFEVPTELCCRK